MLKSVLLSLSLIATTAQAIPYTALINCGESNPYFVDRCFSESDFVLEVEGRREIYNVENSLLKTGYPHDTGIAIELPEHFSITATNTNNQHLTIEIIRNDDNSVIIRKEAVRSKIIKINH
ncbi:hypothetical protein [Enterobacter sp.]|uniref:hypothetical protein n=1 Tax=Enterobacter sp. TaxID=42895 RepID=UPI00298113CA|nr:hypothetical protein [Enterobacter sp.]